MSEEVKDVYLQCGTKAVLHGKSGSQYIVEVYEESHDYYTEEWETGLSGRKIFVDFVYASPSRDLIDKNILVAQEELSEIRSLISTKGNELRDVKSSIVELKNELETIAPLRNVIEFMKGDFKYYALPDIYTGPQILERNIADSDEGQYERETKLLTLFGKSNGDVEWRLNNYSDGSGFSKTAIPCKTIEEAKEVMSDYIFKDLQDRAENNRIYDGGMNKWMIDNGYDTPPLWAEKIIIYNAKNKADSISNLNKNIARDQESLRELESSDD